MEENTPVKGKYTLAKRWEDKDDIYFLFGRNIVFTGRGPYTRTKLMELAKKAGGKITNNTVNNYTDLLIVGEAPGTKLQKAQIKGIEIMSIEDFMDIIKNII